MLRKSFNFLILSLLIYQIFTRLTNIKIMPCLYNPKIHVNFSTGIAVRPGP